MSSNNTRVFGQATRRGRGRGATRYQRQTGNNNASTSHSATAPSEEQERAARRLAMKLKRRAEDEALDERFGFPRYDCTTLKEELERDKASKSGDGDSDFKKRKGSRRGWIFNLLPTVSS